MQAARRVHCAYSVDMLPLPRLRLRLLPLTTAPAGRCGTAGTAAASALLCGPPDALCMI